VRASNALVFTQSWEVLPCKAELTINPDASPLFLANLQLTETIPCPPSLEVVLDLPLASAVFSSENFKTRLIIRIVWNFQKAQTSEYNNYI
jgi:hypothetical protein